MVAPLVFQARFCPHSGARGDRLRSNPGAAIPYVPIPTRPSPTREVARPAAGRPGVGLNPCLSESIRGSRAPTRPSPPRDPARAAPGQPDRAPVLPGAFAGRPTDRFAGPGLGPDPSGPGARGPARPVRVTSVIGVGSGRIGAMSQTAERKADGDVRRPRGVYDGGWCPQRGWGRAMARARRGPDRMTTARAVNPETGIGGRRDRATPASGPARNPNGRRNPMSTIAPTQPMSPGTLAGTPAPASALSEPYRFTVNQYERMAEAGILTEDDRVELINGIVVTKMAKGPGHVWASKSSRGSPGSLARDRLVRAPEEPPRRSPS